MRRPFLSLCIWRSLRLEPVHLLAHDSQSLGESGDFALLSKDHVAQLLVGALEKRDLELDLFDEFRGHWRSLAERGA